MNLFTSFSTVFVSVVGAWLEEEGGEEGEVEELS